MKNTSYLVLSFLFSGSSLFAQTSEEAITREQGLSQTLVMVGVAMVLFYFILWRPEKKRRRTMDDMRQNLHKGDKITAMGIIGTVVRVMDDTLIIKLYDGAKMEILKAAITDVRRESKDSDSVEKKSESSSSSNNKRVELVPSKD